MDTSRESKVILLVEPHRSLASLVASILGKEGYSVLVGDTFEEAVTLMGEVTGIQLLITDVVLGTANGIDLANRFASLQQGAKVLYLSSLSEEELRILGVSPDAKVLMKPLALSDLVAKVLELLH